MSKVVFPLTRSRSFQLGKKWSWRVDVLDAAGLECRLLTAIEPSKEGFLAWLSVKANDAFAVIARYEFHGDEPGWHCHAWCGNVTQVRSGVTKPYGSIRLPRARSFHRRTTYGMTEARALERAYAFFRVQPAGSGGESQLELAI